MSVTETSATDECVNGGTPVTVGGLAPRPLPCAEGCWPAPVKVRAIWRQGSEVVVIEADNQVRDTWEFRGTSPSTPKGRGGTRFDPALKWVDSSTSSFDAAIYFTDGKAKAPTVRPRCGVLWVLPPDGNAHALAGQRVVKMAR